MEGLKQLLGTHDFQAKQIENPLDGLAFGMTLRKVAKIKKGLWSKKLNAVENSLKSTTADEIRTILSKRSREFQTMIHMYERKQGKEEGIISQEAF